MTSKTALLAAALLFWSGAALAADSPAPVPQEFAIGDLQVEMGRPLRLRLNLQDALPLWNCATSVARAMAPAASSSPVTSAARPIEAVVLWNDPAVGERTLPVSESIAVLSSPAGPPRTAVFCVVWKADDGSFELRVPASPGWFRAQLIRPQPAVVVEATGSAEGVLLGDRFPVRVRVTDREGLKSLHLFYRSTSQEVSSTATPNYTSAPMVCAEPGPGGGLWTGTIPRSSEGESTVDYYVEIVDTAGRKSSYGTSTAPHRIRLRAPEPPSAR
ncbi:MAG: hypothetical protein HY814_12550 [Candidatus Riflebacteria bacterium]|nr:hypothetical protein [Candidatus Riflebacteria bacterium]